jgi:UDP-2,3-diacylglucosamine hydrolase
LRRLYVSDLHLETPQSPQFRTFAALLEQHCARLDALFLLGDLCEVWVGDDDDGPFAHALLDLLRNCAARTQVNVMAGNRDFLFGAAFARTTGVRLIDDPHLLPHGILLAHGDAFCVDDGAYQQARALIRSPHWKQTVLARGLPERRALARSLREQSMATNANKAENIMDVSAEEVARVVSQHGADTLIHGHTHRPGIHRAAWGTRYVLGSWEHCAWMLWEQDRNFRLECRPLTGRCET